jgi:hypothetical protein
MGLQGQQAGAGARQIRIARHQKGHQGAAPVLPQGGETLLNRSGGGSHSSSGSQSGGRGFDP